MRLLPEKILRRSISLSDLRRAARVLEFLRFFSEKK